MNALSPPSGPLMFQRIPAEKAASFIRTQDRSVSVRAEAEELLAQIEQQAQQIAAKTEQDLKELEKRIEREAEDIAELSAQKLKVKQEAMNATAAIAQTAAIADDYASLETWITQTIMAAVEGVVSGLSATDRWTGIIRKALDNSKERWSLSITCHPKDYDALTSAIDAAEFNKAITQVNRDQTLSEGTCYLKGNEDYFELNLACQTAALGRELSSYFSTPGEKE